MMNWVGLAIGNSRLHFAWFRGEELQLVWEREHLGEGELPGDVLSAGLGLDCSQDGVLRDNKIDCVCVVSVVPRQTALWRNYAHSRVIGLEDIPLKGLYPSLGGDRALALWGAGAIWGFPCLVIDGGTALTFTGGKEDGVLVGGAILPGLRLQLQSLGRGTAALPEVRLGEQLRSRWRLDTPGAIESGVIYTILAGIKDFILDWWQEFPESQVVLTGGDGGLLFRYLQLLYPEIGKRVVWEEKLIFLAMKLLVGGC